MKRARPAVMGGPPGTGTVVRSFMGSEATSEGTTR